MNFLNLYFDNEKIKMYIQPMSGTKEALQDRVLDRRAALDRWAGTEGKIINDFLAQLPDLTEDLRNNKITQESFFEGLIGDSQPFRTFVKRTDEVSALEPYCIERTSSRKLRISSCQVGEIPQLTAQIGLNNQGRLTIQVSARLIDYETATFHKLTEETISTARGENISRHQFGENMLEALLNNFASI